VATTQASTTQTGPDVASGAAVFTANCASCHTFAAAGATGTVGPNLDRSTLAETAVAKRVTDGRGSMPAFGSRLTTEQIDDVATYVVAERTP
jgi:mono/diheme cytochrome c family protein